MLRKAIYPKVEAIINPIAESLRQKGFTPNQLTYAGLVLNFLAGFLYAKGLLILGALLLLFASLGDLLDGPLARVSKRSSDFGAFLDSTVDRYSDFFIFGGLALYFAKNNEGGWFLIVLGILLGAYVTSYAKARAENLIKHCSVGIFERAERILVIALGTLLPFLLPLCLVILFLGTNVTALHRILYTYQTLKKESRI